MAYLVPDDWQRRFFIARLAWFVQRPERRCPVTILHVSTAHGTGRGWISQLMERVLGKWNCSRTRMKILCDNQFHDYLYHTLLCTIDEVRENDKRYEVNDKIRDVLTEPRFEVNSKYGKKMTIDIFTGFLFYTNHIDALVLPDEDRRIAVLGGPDVEAGEEHYAHLYSVLGDSDFIAQVFWYLMNVDISRFNWQRAPNTKERQLMIESNKSDLEAAVISVLESPPAPAMTYQQIVNEVIKEVGLDAEINQKHITRILKEKTKREPVRVKVDGIAQRFWLLEKNCEFSNEELRDIFETCENLQNQL
ncbi:primase-helicase family protein [Erwinia tracheiphila]